MSPLKQALLASAALTIAVTAAPEAKAQLVDEVIVVTAQKREESVLEVPMAISAVTGDFIDNAGIQDLDDLSDYVAGFTLQLQAVNAPSFIIRGISSDASEPDSEPNVSVFYDGIPASRSSGSVIELFDLERVEIAKGPQGTLFSRGASNGAIDFIMAKPENENSVYAAVEFGNYGDQRYEGIVNGVLAEDKAAVRLGAVYQQRDGFIDNLANPGQKLQGKDTLHLRGSARLTPNDKLDITVLGYYQKDQGDPTPVKTLVPSVAALDPYLQGDTNPYSDYSQDPGIFVDRDLYGITGLVNYEVNDRISVASTTGYRKFSSFDFFDPDGTIIPVFEFTEDDDGDVFFQELRTTFDVNERLRGFAGVSYYKEEATRERIIDLNQNNALNILLPILVPGATLPPFQGLPVVQEDVTVTTDTKSFSAFIDGTYDITDRLHFTAGSRWTHDDKTSYFTAENTVSEVAPGFFLPGSLLPLAFTDFGSLFAYGFGDPTGLGRFVDSLPTNPFTTLNVPPSNPVLIGAVAQLTAGFPGGPVDLTNPLPYILAGQLTPQQAARLGMIETNVLEGTTAGQTISHNVTFDYFEPRFILTYDFSDSWLGYASYSWGIRSGGPEIEPRLGMTDDLYGRTVDPEKVTSYEVGIKGSHKLEGGTMTFEGALYHYDYSDFQTLIVEQGSLQNVNAGKASATGFELATTVSFDSGLDIFGNVGFIDGGFDEGATAGVLGPPIDLSGHEFRLTPKWTVSGGASYTRKLTERLEGFGSVLFSYKGHVWFNPENEHANPLVPVDMAQDGYTTVTLNAGITLDERYALKTHVENLFDEEFLIDAGNTGRLLGVPTAIRGQPRMWTVGLSAKF